MMRRGNKFNARKTACANGHVHDSIKEARRCNELHMLQRAGVIERLEQQPQYWFAIDGKPLMHANGRRVGFKPDFRYVEGGRTVAEDAKGMRTEAYVLRAALFRALFPGVEFREV